MDEFLEKLQKSQDGIKLTDGEKERLISACRTAPAKRRALLGKRIAAISAAAAAIAITVLFAVPNIMLAGSKGSDSAERQDEFFYVANCDQADGIDASGNESGFTAAYRAIYYSIPQEFIELADEDEYERWCGTKKSAESMAIVEFVNHFDISKEKFDRANALYAAALAEEYAAAPLLMPADYPEQEEYEVFNSDIIYSGDTEAVNEYYSAKEYPYQSEAEFAASGQASQAVEFQTETTLN